MGKILPALGMLFDHMADGFWLKDSSPRRRLGEQNFAQKPFHLVAEPLAYGHPKTHFGTHQILSGQQSFQHLFQQVLGRQST